MLIHQIKEIFKYKEVISFFLVLTDKNELFDWSHISDSAARKSNEVDYGFEQYVRYHLKHTHTDIYTPPYRVLRYDFSDISLLPPMPEDIATQRYVREILLPWILKSDLSAVKDFDLRQLYFAMKFDIYTWDAICGSVGIEKIAHCYFPEKRYIVNRIIQSDLDMHRSYDFYCRMLVLQDERQVLSFKAIDNK